VSKSLRDLRVQFGFMRKAELADVRFFPMSIASPSKDWLGIREAPSVKTM
jgi:hypothetical protein